MEEPDGLTWIVKERPERQLGKGQRVRLRTEEQMSGAGKLGHVTALRRHWITLSILGATHKAYLRVPTAWTALDGMEAITHEKHYFTLPRMPRPHPLFRTAIIEDPTTSPYEFDLDEEEVPKLETRIEKITSIKPRTANGSGGD
ncbi:hypothetical protein FOMPIDRAFT_1045484 [Fomitopsis schrenkii]|uniref:Uncharacterized protein n=1 Tax=Fomitopsis schrenkii TaxID=2126942 RepID=S8FUF5_FOMSC|nr:hypothetical protein FOMPIDRAFT_1045484 [Fomitopsis schrenkii]